MERYSVHNHSIIRHATDAVDTLTNFLAKIDREVIYHDGPNHTTYLEIVGELQPPPPTDKNPDPPPRPLPRITIPASEFASLGWVAEKWGMQPIIFPVPAAERDVRTAIQLMSTPDKVHVYTHTGWAEINGRRSYLTMSGAIHKTGLNDKITVQLPQELRNYKLPAPAKSAEAFNASLALTQLAPPEISWPLFAATYRAAIGLADFAIHIAGRTGTFKSELTSLFQSHYGDAMDARHLPASWSSTANALEHLAYRAKDAIIAIDDFVPVGTTWQIRQLQKSADQIIRAQGNQAGRSRLTDLASPQTTYYPRGLILSTGEDVPEGHSIRARMLICEIEPGTIKPKSLSHAQAARPHYPQAMADWVQWLASEDRHCEHRSVATKVRDRHIEVGHTRTPSMLGELIATVWLLMQYATEREYLTAKAANGLLKQAQDAIIAQGNRQRQYLESADPVHALLDTIRVLLSTNIVHVKTKNGGIPADAERWGWTKQEQPGEMPTFKSNGPRLGWIDAEENEFLLDPGSLVLIKKHSGGRISVSQPTLLKRLKEAGVLTRVDDQRQRNTVRVTLEGHPRAVLAINVDELIDEAED